MIRINQLKLPIKHTQAQLTAKIGKMLSLKDGAFHYEIMRQSVDARNKNDILYVYTIDVTCQNESKIVKRCKNKNVSLVSSVKYQFPTCGTEELKHRPVVIGSGPAGIFCAWYLARAGFQPIVLERGADASSRKADVEHFWNTGELNTQSNVQFGEGGAGTFSDGKLNTLVKDPIGRNREVLKRFVEAGAPQEIIYQSKPHLGTDVLIQIVETLRNQIISFGGEVRFHSQVTDFLFENGKLNGVEINQNEILQTETAVLAIGHSARDTFEKLYEKGIVLQPKSFAVGVRVEHPQEIINEALYGSKENEILGAANYKVTHKCENGRGVYSFCMCPGGYVVNASSELNRLAVNGMSYQDRGSHNANSAIIVTISPEDFGGDHPLAGVAYQRKLEEKAFSAGNGRIPVQLFGDYCANRPSDAFKEVMPCMKGAYQLTDVRSILPKEIGEAIEEGIHAFGRQIAGFDREDALLSAIESRTSSPIRITRDENLESSIHGLYPCGEGAGYAGGITSAAMDGIRVAETIVKKFRKF